MMNLCVSLHQLVIDKYINGMDREIVQKIAIENPKTLSTAMKIANSDSFLIKKTASINYASKQVNFKQNKYNNQANNNQKNYENRNNQAKQSSNNYQKNNYNNNQNNKPRTSNYQQNKPDKRNIECFNCGKKGHIKAECRTVRSNMLAPSAPPMDEQQEQDFKRVHVALTNQSGLMGVQSIINGSTIQMFCYEQQNSK